MKGLALSLILISFWLTLHSQSIERRNMLRFGYNISWYGPRQASYLYSDSLKGKTVYLEFAHKVNSYISLVPQVFCGIANHQEKDYIEVMYDYNSTFGISFAARITPLPDIFNRLSIDAGVLYHNIATTFNERVKHHYYILNDYYSPVSMFGFTNSVTLDIIRIKNIESGVRLDLLTGFYKGKLKIDSQQIGFYLGARF